jgi:NAD(P)-dependent dehydrogenase (short-subunit alcohol dehydrogenase family)
MTDDLRFDGRVAIVTGAGAAAGLGRAYARLLASRGARVVVNDLGTGPDGLDMERAHADRVADEIRGEGGEAVADVNSVADEQSASAIVQTALDQYGRVDILVNNAGIVRLAEFAHMTTDDIIQTVAVHQMGTIWMCRAAWPRFLEQEYGRIVNVTSLAMWGARYTVMYGSVKAGILGLTRGLAVEGSQHNVRANAVAPMANTTALYYFNKQSDNPRRSESGLSSEYTPEAVAPVVAYLCHAECIVNGAYVAAGGGHVARGFFATTEGYSCGAAITPEDVAAHVTEMADASTVTELPSGGDILELTSRDRRS